jgi:hypothetical protein
MEYTQSNNNIFTTGENHQPLVKPYEGLTIQQRCENQGAIAALFIFLD